MAAYIHGNLAVEERQSPRERVKIKETRKVVYRASKVSVQEKLLYLFTIVLCVIVAGAVAWRYAQIYEMNTKIQSIEKKIHKLEAENSSLKEMISKHSDPKKLREDLTQHGFGPIPDGSLVRIPTRGTGATSADGLVMAP